MKYLIKKYWPNSCLEDGHSLLITSLIIQKGKLSYQLLLVQYVWI